MIHKGDRKVGHPLTEAGAYAAELGITTRKLKALGGAKKLKAMPESFRNVLIRKTGAEPKSWGLEARGMMVKKPFQVQKEQHFECVVSEMLQERGLHG